MVKFWRIEISLFILIHPFTLSPFLTSYVRPSVTPAPWVRIVRSLGLVFILPKNETSILKHQKRLSLGQQQLGEYQGEPRSDSVGVGQTGPGRTYFYSRAKGSVTSLTLFSQAGASLQGIYSGQPERFPPPPLKFFPVFVDFFCGHLSFIKARIYIPD